MLKRNILQKKKKKKGQSTVEYIILFAAILGALIIFLGDSGPFKTALNDVLSTGTNAMTTMSNRLSNGYGIN